MKHLLFTTLLIYLRLISGQDEGEPCILRSGNSGICKTYSKCQNELKLLRETPKTCSFSIHEAIVCCPIIESKTSQLSPRISEQKCEEYKKLSNRGIQVITLSARPSSVYHNIPKCDNSVKLIVGGEVAKPGEFPHMAILGWSNPNGDYDFQCGGSLISDQYVITASHCKTNENGDLPSIVRLGEQDLNSDNDGANPKDYRVFEFIRHPSYSALKKYHDIALIKLDQKVTLSSHIRPACLWQSDHFNSTKALATGFGSTGYLEKNSNTLLKVSLDILPTRICEETYSGDRKLKQGIIDSQICSGILEGGKDTCQGDSGGPLQVTLENNQCVYYVIGITSFGKACGGRSTPAIYTNVNAYLDWIENIVWQ